MSGSAPAEYRPHDYQRRVVERMADQPHLGLFLDPGLGKTSISLTAFRDLYDCCDVTRMLVVAPLRVAYSVWPREAAKWRQFADLEVRVLHAGDKSQEGLRRHADVYVINPEGLPWLVEQSTWWRLPEMLVVDESTKFKRISSGRSKNLRRLLARFARRYILTGTPAPNGLIDLHGQMFIVDRGASLGKHVGEYREKYFVPVPCAGGSYWAWKPRRGATQQIYDAVAPRVVRLDAKDYLELPEKIQVDVEVDLPDRARKMYDDLKREMVLELAEGDVVAANAGVLTGKCRQVANGSVYLTDDGRPCYDAPGSAVRRARRAVDIHDEKAKALSDLVEELGGKPLLVAYEHVHELSVIRRVLKPIVGREVPYIGGGVSGKRGQELEAAWNRGELPVLLVHPISGAHGLNLQEGGHHLAWYSLTWDLELYEQMVQRVWRQGQTERTFVYHIAARDTIDQTIARALRRKSRDQQDLLDALREDLGVGRP